MPLTKVTFTGADDATSIDELIDFWQEYPFIEWGILIGTHQGGRFPTLDWIRRLADQSLRKTGNALPLALHVCGNYLRDIAKGNTSLANDLGMAVRAFRRVQLNWHGEPFPASAAENVFHAFCNMTDEWWEPQIIFQLDGRNDELFKPCSRRFAVAGLFDRSHGAGVVPTAWPKARPEIQCGWAGGLGPDNLATEIPKISERAWPDVDWWIDMETKVRTDEKFDLSLVRECAELCLLEINK